MRGNLKKFLLAGAVACTLAGLCACGGGGDITPPVFTLYDQPQAYTEESVTIRYAEANDDVDGKVKVKLTVLSPSNLEIGHSNGTFTPHEEGVYRIIFTAKDSAGNTAKEEAELNVRRRGGAPIIIVGAYETQTAEGSVYTLPEYSATDAVGAVDVNVRVFDPYQNQVSVGVGNAFFVDYAGEYTVRFSATNDEDVTTHKVIKINSANAVKRVDGVDGDISDAIYEGAIETSVGGLRNLEAIGVKIARGENGIYFAYDATSDTRVSSGERIELYLDRDGIDLAPSRNNSFRIDLSPDGSAEFMRGTGATGWDSVSPSQLAYSKRPVASVLLGEGTTLTSGNTDDKGYTAEVFVPYQLLGITAEESFYMTMGCKREGDTSGWDGMNTYAVFPDSVQPYRYLEVRADGWLFNDNRLYHDTAIVDGKIDDAIYSGDGAVKTRIGGLRNLEGMDVTIARNDEGLFFAFDVSEDKMVNDYDRVELYLDIGEFNPTLNQECNVVFWIQSNGATQVRLGHNGGYREFLPYDAMPYAATSYGAGTTPNDNTDEDDGYFVELFIPYRLFQLYTKAYDFDKYDRLGLTFGLWRATAEYCTGYDWGSDPNKDWDGWSFGEFCDPLYPSTYAVLLSDGKISTRKAIVDELAPPTDPSVDGKLTEAYWQKGAVLDIPKTEELDGVSAIVYRDTDGLRVAFRGDARKMTSKDVIVFYVSTKDSSYKIGSEVEEVDDSYDVHGRYANIYDYTFQIWLDRSVAVYSGLYKDWANQITDLSALSLAIDKEAQDYSYIAELYIPYSFMKASDGYQPTAQDTLGLSLRLGGENSRGSILWNNYHYAGIYCDSESPASYVRIDKDNTLFAALENNGGYRIDGKFDEAVYSTACATVEGAGVTAKLYRSQKGVHVRVDFTTADSIRLVLSTLDHNLGVPYVYDYQITLFKNGSIQTSFGNTHGFYDPTLYVSYCTPRAVFDGNTAELFISYEYLSRYNTGNSYGQKGWMQITQQSALSVCAEVGKDGAFDGNVTYNGQAVAFDALQPESYKTLEEKEV